MVGGKGYLIKERSMTDVVLIKDKGKKKAHAHTAFLEIFRREGQRP